MSQQTSGMMIFDTFKFVLNTESMMGFIFGLQLILMWCFRFCLVMQTCDAVLLSVAM